VTLKGNEIVNIPIYGKPENVQKNIDNLFQFLIDDINNDSNFIISELIKLNFQAPQIDAIKVNMINYINNYKVEFSSPIFTKINEIVQQQQNMIMLLRQINLIVEPTSIVPPLQPTTFDGKIPSVGIPIIYNTKPTEDVANTSGPSQFENTYDELSHDYGKVLNSLKSFYLDILVGESSTDSNMVFILSGGSKYNEENGTFPNISDKIASPEDQHMFMILSNVFNNSDDLDVFIDSCLLNISGNTGRLSRRLKKICETFAGNVEVELKEEIKLVEKLKNEEGYNLYLNETDYEKGKVREFTYSTEVIDEYIEEQQNRVKELYNGVGGDKWNNVVKLT